MAKVHCVNHATAHSVKIEIEGATPIVPLNPVVIQFDHPQATDEWEIPDAPLSIVLDQAVALDLAISIYRCIEGQK